MIISDNYYAPKSASSIFFISSIPYTNLLRRLKMRKTEAQRGTK